MKLIKTRKALRDNNETSNKSNTSSNKKVKHVCNDCDEGWIKHLREYKDLNDSNVIFYNLKEAINYGEYAKNNLGYGYWYNPKTYEYLGTHYEDENCYQDIYAVQLYVPGGNYINTVGNMVSLSALYIKATPKNKLVEYLKINGYLN